MDILKIVLMILFAIDCIALTAIVLMEGALVKSTKFLAILFVVLAAVLNLKVFA